MTTEFLGITFDDEKTIDGVADDIMSSESAFVVTPNVDHIISFHDKHDTRYRTAIEKSNYILCDSKILKVLSRLRRQPSIKNVVPGSDLMSYMFSKYGNDLGSVLIVGGLEGDDKQLVQQYKLEKIKQIIPSFGFIYDENEVLQLVQSISKSNANVVFICVGSPQQEILANQLYEVQPKGRYLCLGASLDFLMSREKRAPVFLRNLSLEWIYRLIRNPKKMIKRYMYRDVKVFWLVIKNIF